MLGTSDFGSLEVILLCCKVGTPIQRLVAFWMKIDVELEVY